MAQKELEKKQEEAGALDRVPARIGFLEELEAEFMHEGYEGVGQATGGVVRASVGPLELGIGGGAERLEYYDATFPYVAPEFRLEGVLGDFELRAEGSMVAIAQKKGVEIPPTLYGNAGAVWEPLSPEKGNKLSFRLGIGIGSVMDVRIFKFMEKKAVELKIRRLNPEFGMSVGYGGVMLYAIEESAIVQPRPWIYKLHYRHGKTRGGILVGVGDVDLGAEFYHARVEMGGEAYASFRGGYVEPAISVWYSQDTGAMGKGGKGGMGLELSFGAGALRAKTSAKGGFAIGKGPSVIRKWSASPGREARYTRFFEDSVRGSDSISELAAKYRGKGKEAILFAASMLGKYGNENREDGSDEYVGEVAEEGSFRAIRKSQVEGGIGGAGVCVNIAGMQNTFIREALGWDSHILGLATVKSQHATLAMKDPETGTSYFISGGSIRSNSDGRVMPLIRQYAKEKGIVLYDITVYGEGNRFAGQYITEEGKLNMAMGGHKGEGFRDSLLHLRPRKSRKKKPE